mmetsp:Transcript_38516/g.77890  ORF Transcript_38516/g.77890 Transcript_38516/m.77890 type:complete len:111 (-) Transcript_38516:80-412(-)
MAAEPSAQSRREAPRPRRHRRFIGWHTMEVLTALAFPSLPCSPRPTSTLCALWAVRLQVLEGADGSELASKRRYLFLDFGLPHDPTLDPAVPWPSRVLQRPGEPSAEHEL